MRAGTLKTRHTKPLRLTKPEAPESAIQAAVLRYLALDRRVGWCERINTGAHVIGEGKARRFIRYGFKGCSDLVGMLRDGRFLAVECKRVGGRVTDDQEAFLARVRANGGVAGVVRSVDDVEALLRESA